MESFLALVEKLDLNKMLDAEMEDILRDIVIVLHDAQILRHGPHSTDREGLESGLQGESGQKSQRQSSDPNGPSTQPSNHLDLESPTNCSANSLSKSYPPATVASSDPINSTVPTATDLLKAS